jgi:hypothetical protein
MVVRRHWSLGFLAAAIGLSALVIDESAFAQGAAPGQAPSAAAAAPVDAPALSATPTPAAPPLAAEEPPPAAPGSLPELPAPAASDSVTHDTAPTAADDEWYDSFDVRLFADAYFSWNYNAPKPQVGGNDVIRAFDSANGFSLSWAGLDVSHAADPVGGELSLRFGPSAKRYNSSCIGTCDASYGLENVKQAFASWHPGSEDGKVTIDFGKFDTIYGAEVAESQDNINYTRGVLYWLGQPAFHTGLRITAELNTNLTLRALAVNGWNNTVDNNTGKTFGLQASVHKARSETHDWISASLGYLGGPERSDISEVTCAPGTVFDATSATGCSVSTTAGATTGTVDRPTNDTKGWRHFVDLVATSDPIDDLHFVFNADLGVEGIRDSVNSSNFTSHSWYGAMLGARYIITHAFAVAARGELYRDKDGVTTGSVNGIPITGATISTGTVTIDYLPGKNLLVRLENREDHSNKEMFPKGVRDLTGNLVTSTLGVVVTTN